MSSAHRVCPRIALAARAAIVVAAFVLAACALAACEPASTSGSASQPPSGRSTSQAAPGRAIVPAVDEKAIGAVLDDWHAAAAAADEERYFGLMTEDSVFLGTDATERWDKK